MSVGNSQSCTERMVYTHSQMMALNAEEERYDDYIVVVAFFSSEAKQEASGAVRKSTEEIALKIYGRNSFENLRKK